MLQHICNADQSAFQNPEDKDIPNNLSFLWVGTEHYFEGRTCLT